MLRAMYTGVSGLRTHQFKMDVIGNNIANVNTVGYKRSTATFKEVFSQTLQGASAPQGGRAGTNPQQVGLGVTQGSTSVIHTQGAAQTTDNPMDVMIDGDTFFAVSDDANAINRYYTRAGNFMLDEQGTLATPDGFKVLGYEVEYDADGNMIVGNEPGPIAVNKAETMEPTTTKKINMIGNLNSQAEVGDTTTFDTRVYDSLGNSYTLKFKAEKTEGSATGTPPTSGKWDINLSTITDASGTKLYDLQNTINEFDADPAFNQELTFDEKGKLIGDLSEIKIALSKDGVEFGDGAGEINIDFSEVKQYGTDYSISAKRMDGNTAGNVDSFSISNTGELTAIFTNGENKVMGIIAMASFENNGGLEKVGGNLYRGSRNSGDANFGRAGQQGYGDIIAGALEMSNVDLSAEFTDLITTQRGFQSNSRIITTSDEILQELVNLKR